MLKVMTGDFCKSLVNKDPRKSKNSGHTVFASYSNNKKVRFLHDWINNFFIGQRSGQVNSRKGISFPVRDLADPPSADSGFSWLLGLVVVAAMAAAAAVASAFDAVLTDSGLVKEVGRSRRASARSSKGGGGVVGEIMDVLVLDLGGMFGVGGVCAANSLYISHDRKRM